MSKTLYKQCRLVRDIGTKTQMTVSYLPVKFAKTDNIVKLKNEQEEWSDGWRILSVFGKATDEPPDVKKIIRNHRINTGDALPKST